MLDLRRMRILREIALRGSMAAAAKALSYSPSAVSQQVALLEREVGQPLLRRGARGAELTAAGRLIVDEAEDILPRLELLEPRLRALVTKDTTSLVLAAFPSACLDLIPRAIRSFRRTHPDVELVLVEGEPDDYLRKLRGGELDLALGHEYDYVAPLPFEGLERTFLVDDPMWIALPADHSLAESEEIELASLADADWISAELSESAQGGFLVRSCNAAGFAPKIAFETGAYDLAQGLVAVGLGVAMLPQIALSVLHGGVEVRPLVEGGPRRRIVALTSPGHGSKAVEVFLETLRCVAREAAPVGLRV